MEQTAMQNWNLDPLYEGKGQSHNLMSLFNELTKTLETLESNLQAYQAHAEPKQSLKEAIEMYLQLTDKYGIKPE